MDLDIYTTEMSKSIWDKAFFMDKIPGAKYIIDFGCADGAMIHYLAPLFPDITFVGYDINKELIDRARSKIPFHTNEIYFTNINEVILYMQCKPASKSEEICINFSSVLHEVFSSTDGIDDIQDLIEELQPRYITIRDMYCDDPISFTSKKQMMEIWDKLPDHYPQEFMKKFGTVFNWRDLTHLLMKLQWVDNGWEDEMKEDYFSWTLDKLYPIIGAYFPCFEARYQLPYLSEKWKKEYGWYNPDIHTHAQFILRRDD